MTPPQTDVAIIGAGPWNWSCGGANGGGGANPNGAGASPSDGGASPSGGHDASRDDARARGPSALLRA